MNVDHQLRANAPFLPRGPVLGSGLTATGLGCLLSLVSFLAEAVDYFPLTIQTSSTALSPLEVAYALPNVDNVGYNVSANEYGATITLDPNAPFVLRSVVLPYYSDYALASGLIYRIYENDGPLLNGIPTPGRLLDERHEPIVSIGGGSITTLTVSYNFSNANELPPSLTVTVQFTGFGGNQHAGWLLTSADPTVGTHPYYFWERVGQTWTARTFAVQPPARPKVTIAKPSGDQLKVTVTGSANGTYVLQRTADFKNWANVRTNAAGGFEHTQAVTPGPAFFRAFTR